MSRLNKQTRAKLICTSSIAALTAITLSSHAVAQEQSIADESNSDEIIVTGSRIARDQYQTLQPSVIIDRAAIDARGVLDVADVLNEQPGFTLPGSTPLGGQNGSGPQAFNGQNVVNFLGLGSARTLTLVNSKRFVPSAGFDGLQVDMNGIPLPLIERVETIAIGGAPIYGTDAIAGTVNVILKDDFEGIELRGQGGFSPDYGDAFRAGTSIVAGTNFDNDRGNIVASFNYSSQNGLVYGDRPKTAGRAYSFEPPFDPSSPFALELQENVSVIVTDPSGIPSPVSFGPPFAFTTFGGGFAVDPAMQGVPGAPVYQFNDSGNLVPYAYPAPFRFFAPFDDGYDVSSLRALQNETRRLQGNIFARYDITDNVRLKVEGWLTRTNTAELVNEGAASSVVFSSPFSTLNNIGRGPIPVLFTNPYVTDSTRAILQPRVPGPNIDTDGDLAPDATGFWVDRALIPALGGSETTTDTTLYRSVVGLEGDFGIGARDYSWDVSYIFGESNRTTVQRVISAQRLAQAANAVIDPSSSQIVCADLTEGCRPINVMGGNFDPAAVDFVFPQVENTAINKQHYVTANITGPLFSLPAGDVSVAAGFDYRFEKAVNDPSQFAQSSIFELPSTPSSNSFNTKEVYGEALIPIFGGDFVLPFVERLEIEGALRFVDNSIGGGDLTWTAGGRFSPVSDIEIRGNVTESIRAPSLTELFLTESQTVILADDPCDARFIGGGNFPDRRAANCAADGLPSDLVSSVSDALLSNENITISGNQDLNNETAKSWTAGIILRPRYIPGFVLASDWIDIDIIDGIQNLGAEAIMEACYDSAVFPNEPACEAFSRSATGQVVSFQTGFVNVARIEFSGLQSSAKYSFDLVNIGEVTLDLSHLFTKDHILTSGSSNPQPQDGGLGVSKHRITGTAAWRSGPFSINNQVQWLSGAAFDLTDGPNTRDVPRVPSWWVLNSAFGYDVDDNISLQLNVNNITNKKAPRGVPQTFGDLAGPSFITYAPGITGRYMTFSVRARF